MTGIVYSLLPYGGHPTGWTNPWVLAGVFGGLAILGLFVFIETRVAEPMFRLNLFKIRAFTAGNISALLGALGRGGLQLMLIIWLQGISAAPARLQLQSDPPVGRHIHGAR